MPLKLNYKNETKKQISINFKKPYRQWYLFGVRQRNYENFISNNIYSNSNCVLDIWNKHNGKWWKYKSSFYNKKCVLLDGGGFSFRSWALCCLTYSNMKRAEFSTELD